MTEDDNEMSKAEERLVDNEATDMVMETFVEDDYAYPKGRTQFFFKLFWVIGSILNLYITWRFFGSSGFQSHIMAFIFGVIALKIYHFIPTYMDYAEDKGLVEVKEE